MYQNWVSIYLYNCPNIRQIGQKTLKSFEIDLVIEQNWQFFSSCSSPSKSHVIDILWNLISYSIKLMKCAFSQTIIWDFHYYFYYGRSPLSMLSSLLLLLLLWRNGRERKKIEEEKKEKHIELCSDLIYYVRSQSNFSIHMKMCQIKFVSLLLS